jgi:catechol 2,3-dioxygenase-like lactoylglutathione lyase family enzyme
MTNTRFGQVNLIVADMAASVDFYRILGLDVPDPFEWPPGSGAQHVEIHGDSDCYLALDNHPQAQIWNNRFDPDRGRGNAVIGVLVGARDDVDQLYDTVKAAGHPVGQEPYDAFWGSRYAIVIDPDGNQVGLKSPIDDSLAYEPGKPA